MTNTTICFLIKGDQVLLAMKKRGHGAGLWNGVGGKAKKGESIEDSVRREAKEEIGVTLGEIKQVAKIHFTFMAEKDSDHVSTVFLCNEWEGEPGESEEMSPKWFANSEVPYENMWEDDRLWLPKVLVGEVVEAEAEFNKEHQVVSWKEK